MFATDQSVTEIPLVPHTLFHGCLLRLLTCYSLFKGNWSLDIIPWTRPPFIFFLF